MVKRNWKAVEASLTVRAAKSQVRPYSDIIPVILTRRRSVVFWFTSSFTRPRVFRVCFTRMTTTITKITVLKRRMAKIGPRKAPQNTPTSPIKQLEKEMCHVHVI